MGSPQPPKAGQYYLLEKIAQGGMAEIYKGLAYDPAGIKKTVCIKKILPHIAASKEFIDMLVDEAKIAVKLSHGSIAQIYDLGKAGEDYFMVMEYVEGQSLSRIQKKILRLQKRIPIPIVCYLISEIASGLDYMHRKTDDSGANLNIVHRDISPQNIVCSYSGTVKIIDFGIAKAAVKLDNTDFGILKGKFAYMSPEQARGDKLDHRSDIFSLGVIFYELLTGKRLFKGKENKETLRNVKRAKVDPPSKIEPTIPKELDRIALNALTKTSRNRYPFASNLQEELLRFLHTFYPDFKPSHVAEFAQELFKEEMELARKLSAEESKTPHLILEKTKSSGEEKEEEITKGGGIVDWREFMLDAQWPTEEKNPKSKIQNPKEEEETVESYEPTSKKWFPSLSFHKQAALISLVIVTLLVGGIYFWTNQEPSTKYQVPSTKYQVQTPQGKPLTETPPAPKLTFVGITSEPLGARVYINDVDTGKATPVELKDLSAETKYALGLHLEGYQYYKTEFTLEKGETKQFHVVLGLDYASLKIVSNPPAAMVFIDGKLEGETPWFQKSLEPGRVMAIELRKEGFVGFSQELKLEAGKEHVLNTLLERVVHAPEP